MQEKFEILSQVIRERRSVFPKSYIDKEIPKEVIELILESANYAPTHKITEPWRFVVFNGNSKVSLGKKLAELYKSNTSPELFLEKKYESFLQKVSQAACIIAICVEFHPEKVPAWEEVAAVACAVQNMSLTATSLNVGSYWSSPKLVDYLDEYLELTDNQKCLGLFYMGYHNVVPHEAKRTHIDLKVKWRE